MATYANGTQVSEKVVDALRRHIGVQVLWWRHNLATGPSFIREMKPSTPRQLVLPDDDFVVLTSTGKEITYGHGHWMSYSAVDRAVLARAHPRCQSCRGTGVHALSYFENRTEYICTCVHERAYLRAHLGILREVRLDRYEVVVVTADRGWGEEEAELIGKFTSREAAEAEAQKRRRESRFQSGSRYYYGRGPVVVVRVIERPMPEWA